MQFRLLSRKEILDNLSKRMKRDFHASELKPNSLIAARYDEGRYFARGLFNDEGKMLAYAYFVTTDDWALLDYLAVDSNTRGEGIGSLVLESINSMPELEARKLLLEVEDPEFSLDEDDKVTRERRISFYANSDIGPLGVKTQVLTDHYLILGAKESRKEDIELAMQQLYSTIFDTEFLEENVIIK